MDAAFDLIDSGHVKGKTSLTRLGCSIITQTGENFKNG